LVASHSLLSNNDLLASVYDEVTTLVVAAVLTIFYSFVLVEIFKLTEVRAKHDRDFSEVNSLFLFFENHILDFAFALSSLRAIVEVVLKFFLAELDIGVDLSTVGQVSHSGFVRENGHHTFVGFKDSWCCVDVHLSELDFVHHAL
jgi:hypothetical protein